jgi:hypothetical protein
MDLSFEFSDSRTFFSTHAISSRARLSKDRCHFAKFPCTIRIGRASFCGVEEMILMEMNDCFIE